MVVNVSLGDFGSLSLGVRVLCWMNLMMYGAFIYWDVDCYLGHMSFVLHGVRRLTARGYAQLILRIADTGRAK